MQRRNIVDFRRQARSGLGSSGGGAPAFSGVLDELFGLGATVRAAYSTTHRLYSGYTGAVFSTFNGTSTADTPYGASTNRTDTDALAAHCTTNNGFIVDINDQSGNARHRTMATAANRPKIYDSVTGVLLTGSLPYATLDGTDYWARGDACGISGAVAVWQFMHYASNGTSRVLASVGTTTGRYVAGSALNGDPYHHIINGGGIRQFQDSPSSLTTQSYVFEIGAGAAVSTATVRENGVALAQTGLTNGTVTLTVSGAGSTLGADAAGASPLIGGITNYIIGEGALSAPQLAALEAFGAVLTGLD